MALPATDKLPPNDKSATLPNETFLVPIDTSIEVPFAGGVEKVRVVPETEYVSLF